MYSIAYKMQHVLFEDTVVVFTWFDETFVTGALDDDFITLDLYRRQMVYQPVDFLLGMFLD